MKSLDKSVRKVIWHETIWHETQFDERQVRNNLYEWKNIISDIIEILKGIFSHVRCKQPKDEI